VDCRGYRASIKPDATVFLGGAGENKFCYDLGYAARVGARGRMLDPVAKTSNARTMGLLLAMDAARQAAQANGLGSLPRLHEVALPEFYLGFSQDSLPQWEATPRFVAAVLLRLGRPIQTGLGGMAPGTLKSWLEDIPHSILEDVWAAQFLAPGTPATDDTPASGAPENHTGHWLLHHALLGSSVGALRCYADTKPCTGQATANPAATVLPKSGGIELPNPRLDVALACRVNLDAADMSSEEEAALEAEFRQQVGPAVAKRLTSAAIMECLAEAEQPLIVPQGSMPLGADELPRGLLLRAMRQQVAGGLGECCTEDDLMQAVRQPTRPLIASGKARIQLFFLPGCDPRHFVFQKAKITADLWTAQDWYYPKGSRREAVIPS